MLLASIRCTRTIYLYVCIVYFVASVCVLDDYQRIEPAHNRSGCQFLASQPANQQLCNLCSSSGFSSITCRTAADCLDTIVYYYRTCNGCIWYCAIPLHIANYRIPTSTTWLTSKWTRVHGVCATLVYRNTRNIKHICTNKTYSEMTPQFARSPSFINSHFIVYVLLHPMSIRLFTPKPSQRKVAAVLLNAQIIVCIVFVSSSRSEASSLET